MPIDDLSKVVLPEFAECLSEVVDYETIVVSEELGPHLRYFPAGKIEVKPVDKCHVVTNDVGHWLEKVPRLNHDFDRLVGVSEHRNTRVAGCCLLTALVGA